MNDMTVPRHVYRIPNKDGMTTRTRMLITVLDGFTRGIVTMSTLGLVQPTRIRKTRPSDASALASDWVVVGSGLKRSAARANRRVRG